jgi:hypothetical protein
MSLWKKTKELFKRLKGDDSNTPPPAPSADPLLPLFIEPLPEYQQRQRDFEARAAATALRWNASPNVPLKDRTCNLGRNAAKRRMRVGPRKYWPVLKAVA